MFVITEQQVLQILISVIHKANSLCESSLFTEDMQTCLLENHQSNACF